MRRQCETPLSARCVDACPDASGLNLLIERQRPLPQISHRNTASHAGTAAAAGFIASTSKANRLAPAKSQTEPSHSISYEPVVSTR